MEDHRRHSEDPSRPAPGETEGRAANREPTYPAEEARQGSIILDTPWKRGVFASALVAAVILATVVLLVA